MAAFRSASLFIVIAVAYTICLVSAQPLVLTADTFQSTIDDHSKAFFVKFFAPWCGHCKRLAPTWEQLSKSAPETVVIATVDCTAQKKLCEEHEIGGYPSLKLFVKGKAVDKYNGDRSLEALQEYAWNAAEDLKEA